MYFQVWVFNVGQRRTGQVAESADAVSRVAHVERLAPVVDAQTLLAASFQCLHLLEDRVHCLQDFATNFAKFA